MSRKKNAKTKLQMKNFSVRLKGIFASHFIFSIIQRLQVLFLSILVVAVRIESRVLGKYSTVELRTPDSGLPSSLTPSRRQGDGLLFF